MANGKWQTKVTSNQQVDRERAVRGQMTANERQKAVGGQWKTTGKGQKAISW